MDASGSSSEVSVRDSDYLRIASGGADAGISQHNPPPTLRLATRRRNMNGEVPAPQIPGLLGETLLAMTMRLRLAKEAPAPCRSR